jgi:hypothetical protein
MSTTTADLTLEVERDRSAARHNKLAEAVKGLRTKAGGADGARALLILGGILLPLGFVFILLGWNGASNTVNLFEQIPYAISGGMLGLAFVFAGGFCYFAYWLTQLVYAARRDASDTRAILERIEELLASGAALQATAAEVAPLISRDDTTGAKRRAKPLAATAATAATSAPYLATATGTMYHRPDCPAVAGRDGVREVSGQENGLVPCRICEPSGV